MSNAILTVNAGSSSIKFALFHARSLKQFVSGQIENIGTAPKFSAHDAAGVAIGGRQWPGGAGATHEDVFADLLTWIDDHLGSAKLIAAGHRVVHGGRTLAAPVAVTEAVLTELDALVPLAPLHQPHALHGIRALTALRPHLPQIACFDTAFHRTLSSTARRFALPLALSESGVERYGFHGLSYEYIAWSLREHEPALAKGRVVVAHLGNGSSQCALLNGVSVDTTMGFTALDGMPMGTRCGAIDPGVLLYLQQARGMSVKEVEKLLYQQSGLLGMSGISADMRTLIASADPHAAEAVAVFCHRAAREIGALTVSLGGLDGIVFTAGIGEHAAEVRARICAPLGWLGVTLDPEANARNAARIDAPGSPVAVRVIRTDEEAMIARHTSTLLRSH